MPLESDEQPQPLRPLSKPKFLMTGTSRIVIIVPEVECAVPEEPSLLKEQSTRQKRRLGWQTMAVDEQQKL
jgi:hypothetical protein